MFYVYSLKITYFISKKKKKVRVSFKKCLPSCILCNISKGSFFSNTSMEYGVSNRYCQFVGCAHCEVNSFPDLL